MSPSLTRRDLLATAVAAVAATAIQAEPPTPAKSENFSEPFGYCLNTNQILICTAVTSELCTEVAHPLGRVLAPDAHFVRLSNATTGRRIAILHADS